MPAVIESLTDSSVVRDDHAAVFHSWSAQAHLPDLASATA